ncbi:hypothetical protein D7Y13_23865 [Corallococcus praedator]|uniref:Uncharacterized protein n=1 Tax=Corallococcus praedator TaxID=2316724 RepID=A0ABX9QE88_9BACT|nr:MULTISPECIES: hypothetical protein [Corallococcus]RKH23925.1 hypothetical protein D7X75_32850 [Corallococcus sp. CA031C]RKI02731.1 hypothetical protein D7Y13_23865 [Corallococcus praedator]
MRNWWNEARGGAEHFQAVRGALPEGRIRQFFYGASLPFHIARTTLADAPTRARYLRVTCLQTAFLVALTGLWAANNFQEETAAKAKRAEQVSRALSPEAEARLEQRARELEAALGAKGPQGTASGDTPSVSDAVSALVEEAVNAAKEDGVAPDEAASAAGDAAEEAAEAAKASDEEEDGEALGQQVSATVRAAIQQAIRGAPQAPKEKGPAIQKEPQKKGFNIDKPELRQGVFFLGSWEFWVLFFTSLSAVQWLVVALSRDFHTVMSREASLATGIAPEDPEIAPRVRLNIPWIKAKLRRRWRAFVLFALGFPAVALITAPVCWSDVLFTTLSTAWGFWWLVVFTAAKSDRAWVSPVSRPPWFLRGWAALARVLPFLRWGPFRWYEGLLTRRSADVASPIASVERQPWAFSGLALSRFVGSLPPFRCFTRPFMSVAAAHLHSLDPQQPSKNAAPPAHDVGD